MKYAILDIETTGGSPKHEKITEIAVFLHDGTRIVEEFSSLINPERNIPPFITRLTGISNEMVADAPKFYEIAARIVDLTENCTIVAHNVSFDYSFIQNEFKQLGYDFRRETLCTVKLSRKLIPGFRSYSLGKLCDQLDIHINGRHRASGDALATVQLFELLLKKDMEVPSGLIAVSQGSPNARNKNLNGYLTPESIREIPAATGVYYFHDSEGNLLYVGKSTNIHQRVLSHLGNRETKRSIELRERIAGISFELTGSELIALLLESEEIKKNKPRYNRAQRRTSSGWGLYSHYDSNGYINFEIKQTGVKNSLPVTGFNNKAEARQILTSLVEKHWLCQKLSGLYETEGACFHYGIRQCNGACIGKESAKTYNERAQKLIKNFDLVEENVLIIDGGRTLEERSAILIEKGIYKGFGYFDISGTYVSVEDLKSCIKQVKDTREVRQIINSWLRRHKPEKLLYF